MSIKETDLSKVKTISISTRSSKVNADHLAKVPSMDISFDGFMNSLPDVLKAKDFKNIIDCIVEAVSKKKGVIVMIGGHVVKTGISPLLIELMKHQVITHIAMNGSAAIHDYEMTLFGNTSEDVASGLRDGTFGMADETGSGLNTAFIHGMCNNLGMGESIGYKLQNSDIKYPEYSVVLNAYKLGIPVTVHPAIGAEIIHQHPSANGAAIGDTGHRDFRRLAASCETLHEGGVVLNLGSAVIMPEVFLKALTIARNVTQGKPINFTTINFDMQQHYRPRVNVVERPILPGGVGYEIIGHHEIMIPLLTWGVLSKLV